MGSKQNFKKALLEKLDAAGETLLHSIWTPDHFVVSFNKIQLKKNIRNFKTWRHSVLYDHENRENN